MNDTPSTAAKVTWTSRGDSVRSGFQFRRFGRVKVVPEDGTFRTVQLNIQDAPMDVAVAQLAKWVNREVGQDLRTGSPRRIPASAPERRRGDADAADPEQMRQRMENFQPTPEMQERAAQRMLSGIKNSSAEQRAMQRRQRGGRGGPGGGGGGGPR